MDELITIKKSEYEKLKKDAETLRRLEIYGVDNWEGYEMALNDEEGWC